MTDGPASAEEGNTQAQARLIRELPNTELMVLKVTTNAANTPIIDVIPSSQNLLRYVDTFNGLGSLQGDVESKIRSLVPATTAVTAVTLEPTPAPITPAPVTAAPPTPPPVVTPTPPTPSTTGKELGLLNSDF